MWGPFRYLLTRAGVLQVLVDRRDRWARRGRTPWCGAHEGVYEVVVLPSGREGSSRERGAHEEASQVLVDGSGIPFRYLLTIGIVGELGACRRSTSWLGCGAHEGVYKMVELLSGREGSSQGRELGAGAPLRTWARQVSRLLPASC